MKLTYWTAAPLLCSLAQGSVLPWKFSRHQARQEIEEVGEQVEVVLSSIATVEDLAIELFLDYQCLADANPDISQLNPGESCFIPYFCCGTSCEGDFCSKRLGCNDQTDSTAPVLPSGTSTSVVSTITTSLYASAGGSAPPAGSESGTTSTAVSGTSTAILAPVPSSSTTEVIPPASSTTGTDSLSRSTETDIAAPTSTLNSGTGSNPSATDGSASPTSGSATTTNSLGETVISWSSGVATIPPGISSTSLLTLSDGSVLTYVPSPPSIGPSSGFSTGISSGTGSETLISSTSTAISGSTTAAISSATTLSDGSVSTISHATSSVTTLSDGSVSTIEGTSTGADLSTSTIEGAASSVTTLSDGSISTIADATPSVTTLSDGFISTVEGTSTAGTLSDGSPSTITSDVPSITTLPDGSVSTIVVESPSVTTLTDGAVVTITDSDSSVTDSATSNTDSASVTTLSDGSVSTIVPSEDPSSSDTPPSIVTSTTDGVTYISGTAGATTLPTGITTTSLVTLPDGLVVTWVPDPPQSSSSTNTSLVTSTSDSSSTEETSTSTTDTSSIESSTSTTETSSIESTTTTSEDSSSTSGSITGSPSSTSTSPPTSTTDSTASDEGETTLTSTSDEQTTTTSDSSEPTSTNSDESSTTTTDDSSSTTTTDDSSSPTTTDDESSPTTTDDEPSPTATDDSSSPTATDDESSPTQTDSDDESSPTITDPPSPTTTDEDAGIIPVPTPVSEPKPTDGGTEIPCNYWFFDLCLDWEETHIGGWIFPLTPGVLPPGPPPPIKPPPGVTISSSGPLPIWPTITVGPDLIPTFPPKPSDGPDDGCETESAELCFTSTSFGVDSATVTTTTAVVSTCATVYGCNVEDSATTTSFSSTSSGYQYYCTAGCSACLEARDIPTATAAPSPRKNASPPEPTEIVAFARNLTLGKRDIPLSADYDGVPDLYDGVQAASPIIVPLDQAAFSNGIERGVSSSRFRYFDDSEFNVMVRGLRGCTSVVVVSRLGVYATHFWEGPSFTGSDDQFQTDVIDYLAIGREDELSSGETQVLTDLAEGGVFGDTDTTKIFIMTPAGFDLDLTEDTSSSEQFGSLTQGDNEPLYGSGGRDRLGAIRTQLEDILPGVEIAEFVYRRQLQDNSLQNGAYGANMILYSNKQIADPDDIFEALEAPQKAIWQVWMQGSLMGSDIWNALPGQSGECSNEGNQKRQDGGVCSLPATTTAATTTTEDSSSTTTGSTATSETGPVTITATMTGETPESITNFPTLTQSATISTPDGSSCVSTTTTSRCVGSGNRDPVCDDVPACASFVATATSTTTSEEEPSPSPTGGQVYINIYNDGDCTDMREEIIMNAMGETYQSDEQFECFSVTALSELAAKDAALSVSKGSDCVRDTNENENRRYWSLEEIQHEDVKPFKMGCLTLLGKPWEKVFGELSER